MSAASPPGWHPDPSGDVGMLRWWDGSQWTEHRHPVPGTTEPETGPGAATTDPAASPPGAAQQPGPAQTQPPYGQQPPYAQQPPWAQQGQQGGWHPQGGGGWNGQPYGGPGQAGGWQGRRGMGRLRGANSFSWTAIGFSAAYLVLALATGFVLLGIVPVMSSVRAFQRREKLAPVAIAAAAITVAVAIYVFTHRHVT